MANGTRNKAASALDIIKSAATGWMDDNASTLAAALSFFTVLSLAPLLLLLVSIFGLVVGEGTLKGEVIDQVSARVGQGSGDLVRTMLDNAGRSTGGIVGIVAGTAILVLGATGVLLQLQWSLNRIWGVEPAPGGRRLAIARFFTKRLFSFLVILVAGVLLLASLFISTATASVTSWAGGYVGGAGWLSIVLGVMFSVVLLTLLFAFIYKMLPDVDIGWGELWTGSFFTAVLFVMGTYLIGAYLGRAGTASTFGAFGAPVVLLLWIYYSAQVFFFGAELTQAYARARGAALHPQAGARWLPGAMPGAINLQERRAKGADHGRAQEDNRKRSA